MSDAALADHPFVTGLSAEHLDRFEACSAGRSSWSAGQVVLRRGGDADVCHLVESGTIALEIRAPGSAPTTIQTLHRGDLLGWSWLFEPHIWTFDARAVEDSVALTFHASRLREQIEEDCEFGLVLMRRVAKSIVNRLKATRLQVLDVYNR